MKPYDGKNRVWEYLQEHKLQRRWQKITVMLAVLVVAATTAIMILPGITMEQDTDKLCCELNLHQHSDSCYDENSNLICGYADFVVHTHDESCYDGDKLICPLEEIEVHTHDESCYQDTFVLVCGLEETEGHTHTDQCYQWTEELTCGKEECAPHTHDDSCYDENGNLICEKSEE